MWNGFSFNSTNSIYNHKFYRNLSVGGESANPLLWVAWVLLLWWFCLSLSLLLCLQLTWFHSCCSVHSQQPTSTIPIVEIRLFIVQITLRWALDFYFTIFSLVFDYSLAFIILGQKSLSMYTIFKRKKTFSEIRL